jgi:heptosyltransferase-2
MGKNQKILIIQTAFIGDVILATALIENVRKAYPSAEIFFLLRKGNEGLLQNNPNITEVLSWDKKGKKLFNYFRLIIKIRKIKFDVVFNLHRYLSSGIISVLSGANEIRGFNKNPLSFLFKSVFKHKINSKSKEDNNHEVDRNNMLISDHFNQIEITRRPILYPSVADFEKVKVYNSNSFVTISPSSVWFTKQWPLEKWLELIEKLKNYQVYILGGEEDKYLGDLIVEKNSSRVNIKNLAGRLSFLQSAALMKNAIMNFVNDSAPLHIASAMNAPVTVAFCSTIPEFGFGPLSDRSILWEVEGLYCRPCGLHGYKECPEGHFKCAWGIKIPSNVI